MSDSPYVSVLLPVRNGLPWLGVALESIRRQIFDDFELIVLEDGSTDDTPGLLSKVADRRLRIISTGGVGIARALNIGLEAARGTYIARQDADDESRPDRLARQVAALDADPRIDVMASVAEYIDEAGRLVDNAWTQTVRQQQDVALTPEAIADLMPLTCCITHGSILARADALCAVGGYRPEMVPAEDYDLWLRLLPDHGFTKLAEPLYRHRLHDAQSGARARTRQTELTILAKLQYVRRLYPELATPARLAIVGNTRGDAYYRTMAPEAEFEAASVIDEAVSGQRSAVSDQRSAVSVQPSAVSGQPSAFSSQLSAVRALALTACDWDVLVVTDFAALDRYRDELRGLGIAIDVVGNTFVNRVRDTMRGVVTPCGARPL
jgi:glycosyltransferase involved in cell wall biosynthesis